MLNETSHLDAETATHTACDTFAELLSFLGEHPRYVPTIRSERLGLELQRRGYRIMEQWR